MTFLDDETANWDSTIKRDSMPSGAASNQSVSVKEKYPLDPFDINTQSVVINAITNCRTKNLIQAKGGHKCY